MLGNNTQMQLLVIDDDESMLRLIRTIVELQFKDEVNVVDYSDPIDALAEIEKRDPEFVLTDLDMPNVNGLDILKAAKKRNPLAQVILLTGHSNHESLLAALEGGACDYVLKPIEIRDPLESVPLVQVISQALNRRKRWQEALALTWQHKRLEKAGQA